MTNVSALNITIPAMQDTGNPWRETVITKDTILELCGQLQNADQQILTTVIITFCLLILSSVWYGVVRGNGGLSKKLMDKYGHINHFARVLAFLDGLILPGACFSCAIALAQLVMWA